MSQDSVLKLIIVDDSLNDAEKCVSSLRSLGYAIKSTRVEDAEDFIDALESTDADMILCSLESAQLPLSDIVTHLNEQRDSVPIIALAQSSTEMRPDGVMSIGASDLVHKDNTAHLKLVVAREIEKVRSVRQLAALQSSYLDSEKRCQVLMESSRDAIAYVHDGMHVYANVAYLDLFGFENFDEIEGTPIMDMVATTDQTKLKDFLRQQGNADSPGDRLEVKLQHADQRTFSGEMEFSRATIDGEACTQIVIRDQTNSKEMEKQLTLLSQTDQLTGLYNRQHLINTLQETATAAAVDESKTATLFMVELGDMETVRAEAGVLGGDQVIKQAGEALGKLTPKNGILARFEGPVFAMLTPASKGDAVEGFAGTLVKTVEKLTTKVGEAQIQTSCHVGICRIDKGVGDANEALSRVERALAEAGESDKKIALYQPKEGERTQKQIDDEWTQRLKNALDNNELQLLFQPIVSLGGDEMERFEVSVRMRLNDQDMDEAEYLPIAERTGMLNDVDRWVLINTLNRLADKLKENENAVFFLRLSRSALDDGEQFRWIHDRVKALNLPYGSLVFQFDEQAALSHLKQARAFSFALHKINCKISLDNFGTGPNPFQLLKHVPADYLKINRAFMHGLLSNNKNQEAISKIAAKAKELGKPTIAPHVEDAGSLSVLWSLGTDLIQGNFLQDPTDSPNYDFSAMMA